MAYFTPPPAQEIRGVWLHGKMFGKDPQAGQAIMKKNLKLYQQIGLTHLFCFESLPMEHQLGWDWLKCFIPLAKQYGMEIHPVITPGFRQLTFLTAVKKNPLWLITDIHQKKQQYLNLTRPDVHEFILGLVKEALNYDISGIQLDYIRFQVNFAESNSRSRLGKFITKLFSFLNADDNALANGLGLSYDADTILRFEQECHVQFSLKDIKQRDAVWLQWLQWNADQVTKLVERIADLVKSKHQLILSAAIAPDSERALLLAGQDWPRWIFQGTVDIICPMLYTPDLHQFEHSLKKILQFPTRKNVKICPGIALSTMQTQNTPAAIAAQISIQRRLQAHGYVFFSAYSLTPAYIQYLKKNVFR